MEESARAGTARRGGRPGRRRDDGVHAGGMDWLYRGGVAKTGLRHDGSDRSGRAAGGTATDRGDRQGRDASVVRTPILPSVAASSSEGKLGRATIVDGCRVFWQPPSRPTGTAGPSPRRGTGTRRRPGDEATKRPVRRGSRRNGGCVAGDRQRVPARNGTRGAGRRFRGAAKPSAGRAHRARVRRSVAVSRGGRRRPRRGGHRRRPRRR